MADEPKITVELTRAQAAELYVTSAFGRGSGSPVLEEAREALNVALSKQPPKHRP